MDFVAERQARGRRRFARAARERVAVFRVQLADAAARVAVEERRALRHVADRSAFLHRLTDRVQDARIVFADALRLRGGAGVEGCTAGGIQLRHQVDDVGVDLGLEGRGVADARAAAALGLQPCEAAFARDRRILVELVATFVETGGRDRRAGAQRLPMTREEAALLLDDAVDLPGEARVRREGAAEERVRGNRDGDGSDNGKQQRERRHGRPRHGGLLCELNGSWTLRSTTVTSGGTL